MHSKPAQYAVMLHAFNLLIPNSSGDECIGGVRTWRYVRADDEEKAVQQAIALLARDEAFRQHIRNTDGFPPSFEATKVVKLERDDLPEGDGTGLVFYIDPGDQGGH